MLNLDAAVQIEGLTLFQDFSDPNLYHYLPDHPEIAREGRDPLFQLLLYREEIADDPAFAAGQDRGGGFLTMTVDLKVPQAKLDAVQAALSSSGGEIRLVPVDFEGGKVRVTSLGTSGGSASGTRSPDAEDEATPPGFVEEILGSSTPSLYGDNRAVFSLELSSQGALLMAASLVNDGASSIAIVYELEYLGLKPARDVKIVIEASQIYDYLHNQVSTNTLWFQANIDAELEKLEKLNHIRIEDVDYLGTLGAEERARREGELNTLARELAQWAFFKPGLKPGEVLAKDRGDLTIYDPTTDAARVTAGFSTPLQTAATGRGNTGDTAGPRPQGKAALATVTRVSGATPPATPTPTATTPTHRPLTAVEKWNQAGRPQAGFLLRTLKQEERTRITYSMRTVSAHRRTAAPQGSIAMASGDADLPGRIVQVDLDDAFFQVLDGTVTTSADLAAAGVQSMVVALRYGWDEDGGFPKDSQEFVLDSRGEEGSFQFWMDDRKTTSLEYRVQVNYRPDYAIGADSTSLATGWIATELRNLDIDPRAVQGLLPVQVTAGQVNWEEVSSIQARVGYRDADAGIDASRTVVIDQENTSATVPIRPAASDRDAYTVTAQYFYESGGSETVEQQVDGSITPVLNQPPSTAVSVRLHLADPLARLKEASVELAYTPTDGGPAQISLLTLGGDQPTTATWSFFRPRVTDPTAYRYRVTLFGRDTTDVGGWLDASDRQLLVGDIFPGMLEVQVEVIGDVTEAGFSLARLVLDYPGAAAGADGREERTLRGAVEPFTWKVPSATREPGPFTYRIEFFRPDRTSVVEEAEVAAESLLLWVPNA